MVTVITSVQGQCRPSGCLCERKVYLIPTSRGHTAGWNVGCPWSLEPDAGLDRTAVSVHSTSLWVVLHFNLTIFYLKKIMFFHFEGKKDRHVPYKYFSFPADN